jgi:hypothetical protein
MLFQFCIYFIVLSFTSIMFIIISADTRHIKPEYVEHVEYMHDMLLKYAAPVIAVVSFFLIPAVIVWGV